MYDSLLVLLQEQVIGVQPPGDIDREVADCVDFALNAPEPPAKELTKYIWAEEK